MGNIIAGTLQFIKLILYDGIPAETYKLLIGCI